jgi:hypothetical protein
MVTSLITKKTTELGEKMARPSVKEAKHPREKLLLFLRKEKIL